MGIISQSALRLCIAFFVVIASVSHADELPHPKGQVVLTITGKILNSNSEEGVVRLDMAMLESLPAFTFQTVTPWTEGLHTYKGVLLNELLAWVDAEGDQLKVTALNDYSTLVEVSRIKPYPIILAYKSDGDYMKVRNKGPLWLLYPLSDYPELDTEGDYSSMVWQVKALVVQ
ncbi:hypothetical protein [Neptunomonas antarctica]|uniref:Oxidoreductase molybdopterin-binding domain-containing protein n=1 Tax=Neptunomonas antarctica TaxID=619304 RepID=A0A1N7J1G1_9GAMM|nr:hypothetical protein [Neptunomonas antarctica]SIS43218.1 hypothetical protein SAMN05421760_101473 [Neptunomonas antarctica]